MSAVEPDRVVGARPVITRRTVAVMIVALLLLIALVVIEARRGNWFMTTSMAVYFVVVGLIAIRPPVLVDSAGIRRPWTRRRWIDWDEVASVETPLAGVGPVRVNLVDGLSVPLRGIPATATRDVAHLGRKPVERARVPAAPPAPLRETTRSAQQVEADVERRAAALAVERERLAQQSRTLHRPRQGDQGEGGGRSTARSG